MKNKPSNDQEWVALYENYLEAESEGGSDFGYRSSESQLKLFEHTLYSMGSGRGDYTSKLWRDNHTLMVAMATFFKDRLIGYGSFATLFDSPFNDELPRDQRAVIGLILESDKQAYARQEYYSCIGLDAVAYRMTEDYPTSVLGIDFETGALEFLPNDFDMKYYVWKIQKASKPTDTHHKVQAGKVLWSLSYLSENYTTRTHPFLVDLLGQANDLVNEIECVDNLARFLNDYDMHDVYSDIRASEILVDHNNQLIIVDQPYVNERNTEKMGWSDVGCETHEYKDHWLNSLHGISTPSLLGYFEGIKVNYE